MVLVGPSHWVTGSSGQSITEAKLQEQWTTIRTTGEYALEVEEETSVTRYMQVLLRVLKMIYSSSLPNVCG